MLAVVEEIFRHLYVRLYGAGVATVVGETPALFSS